MDIRCTFLYNESEPYPFKGIVHCHHLLTLKLFQTCVHFFIQKTDIIRKKIFGRMSVIKKLMDPIDFHCIFFFLLWKSMGSINGLVTDILPNIFLCVQQKDETHTHLRLMK